MRIEISVEVDTDMVPGWGYDPLDYVRLIERLLNESIGHYNPTVELVGRVEAPTRSKEARLSGIHNW